MKKPIALFFVPMLILSACQKENKLNEAEFKALMNQVAIGWSTQNTTLALSSFDVDAIYMEPPNIQYYQGHEQLRPYFDELTEAYKMKFHRLWFDTQTQTGAGEYTFSYEKDSADTGTVVVELKNGKIIFWREYQRKGPADFKDYLRIDNKEWEWHIGNYPEPKDSLPSK